MSTIRFYHLQRTSQEQVLPVLLSKALEKGHRVVLKMPDQESVERMNAHLWSYDANSFLPHGSAQDGDAALQPIWLTAEEENPNEADVLILAQGAVSQMQEAFDLCCEILDGHNAQALEGARVRWAVYKERSFDVTYWQQGDNGAWVQKA